MARPLIPRLWSSIVRGTSSPERRSRSTIGSTLTQPGEWLLRLLGRWKGAAAGIEIDELNALNLATVWACVTAVSQDLAKMPLGVYRVDPKTGAKTKAFDHPLYDLLRYEPNPETTPAVFRETLTAHALTWGNGYAIIERDGAGRPTRLWQQKPGRTTVQRLNTGEIIYRFTGDDGKQQTKYADDVLHIRGLGYDGLVGYSVIRQARQSLGAVAAAEKFGSDFFGNSAIPAGVLKHPGKLRDGGKALRDSWKALFGREGSERGGTAVLEEGVTFERLTLPNEDAQFLETRQFDIPQVCRWFRVPPHKVFDLMRGTFSNIEHQSIEYVTDSLLTWAVRWEQELERKCFSREERSGYDVEHKMDGLLRGDTKSRYEAYKIAREWGWMSANDILRKENENPIPNGDGYLVPLNMTSGATPPRPNTARAAAGVKPMVRDWCQRALRVEADKVRRAAGKGELLAWADEFYPGHAAVVRSSLQPVLEAAAAWTDLTPAAFGGVIDRIADSHCRRSMADIRSGPDGLEERLKAWEGRPDALAEEFAELITRAVAAAKES